MAKKDWELGHLQALKKEEEKRAAEEEDEILYTYSREEAFQVKKNKSKRRSRPNSRCPIRKSSSSKVTVNVNSQVKTSKEAPVAVESNRSASCTSSRASSRSSSCSSSKRVTRRTKLPDEM